MQPGGAGIGPEGAQHVPFQGIRVPEQGQHLVAVAGEHHLVEALRGLTRQAEQHGALGGEVVGNVHTSYLGLVEELGLSFLRYGPPLHLTWLRAGRYAKTIQRAIVVNLSRRAIAGDNSRHVSAMAVIIHRIIVADAEIVTSHVINITIPVIINTRRTVLLCPVYPHIAIHICRSGIRSI